MFAHMPLFRTEHHDAFDRLYNFLTQPMPTGGAVRGNAEPLTFADRSNTVISDQEK